MIIFTNYSWEEHVVSLLDLALRFKFQILKYKYHSVYIYITFTIYARFYTYYVLTIF